MIATLLRYLKQRNLLPRISDTERAALEAGTVWIEGDLFRGNPDFRKILSEPYPELTNAEREFVDGPLKALCDMLDDWTLRHDRRVPPEVWEHLRKHRFFGLRISPEYGGHGFSALACSTIFGRLAVRSMLVYAVVLIPNSVGPGELIEHFGTPDQKRHYLPRLASGDEIPCFALTEPEAGSDAASIRSSGVVFRGEDGCHYIRLNWSKRFITLAPIATLLGIAFRLFDPDNLLGKGTEPGITFAVVPSKLDGVESGLYHDPMVAFANGPTRGTNVVVPVSAIIGGAENAGRGWPMLMEALAAGRAISLPAQSAFGARALGRIVGAYSVLRQQFGLSIGRMEGVQEPLARMTGFAYLMEAARVFTCGAVDRGKKPALAGAICKYNQTELARRVVNDAMDVLAGKGLCRGPNNPVSEAYMAAPVGITVEGANILTRTLIVFGQGLVRCHPFLRQEMDAVESLDTSLLWRALRGHVYYTLTNALRCTLLCLTRGWLAAAPVGGPTARYYKKLAWASAHFALLADVAVVCCGSSLKRRGRLAGRFADVLSWMFLGTATLRRFEAEGRKSEDLPLVDWALQYSLWRIQEAVEGIYENLDVPLLAPLIRLAGCVARANPVGRPPSDRLGSRVALILQNPGPQRDRLTGDISQDDGFLARLEEAFVWTVKSAPASERIRRAVQKGRIADVDEQGRISQAQQVGVITNEEARLLLDAAAARHAVLSVDDFAPEAYLGALSPAVAAATV